MNQNKIFISKLSAWAPGIETIQEWEEWAIGKRDIICSPESPEIKFTDPMLRRRISQISKMTIQVVHDLLPVQEDTKILFLSFRGEITRQYKINETQIVDGSISPAAFSLSVFNTPVALASIALGLKGGYTAIYPADNSIYAGLAAAAAMLNTGVADELIVVYADEEVPQEYSGITGEQLPPFAFGVLLSRKENDNSICYSLDNKDINPKDFLKYLLLK